MPTVDVPDGSILLGVSRGWHFEFRLRYSEPTDIGKDAEDQIFAPGDTALPRPRNNIFFTITTAAPARAKTF